jgi:drug/metabolite transporter (DMT)-like permease
LERRFALADLLLIIVAVIWGFNVVAVKLALGTLTPLTFNALRFVGAALASWLLLSFSGQGLLHLKADWRRIGVLGLLGHGVYQVMFILGTNLTSAGNTALLLATIPVWVAALIALKDPEPVPALTWLFGLRDSPGHPGGGAAGGHRGGFPGGRPVAAGVNLFLCLVYGRK